jgi:hypothetical protein
MSKEGDFWDQVNGNEEKIVWGQSAHLHPGSRFMGCLGVNTNICAGVEANINAGPMLNVNLLPTLTYQGADAITKGPGSAYTINTKTETVSMDEILLVGGVTGAYRLEIESICEKIAIIAASLLITGVSLIPPVVTHFTPDNKRAIDSLGIWTSFALSAMTSFVTWGAVNASYLSYIGPEDSLNIPDRIEFPDTPDEQAGGILRLDQNGVNIIGTRGRDLQSSRPQIRVGLDCLSLAVNRQLAPTSAIRNSGKRTKLSMDNSGMSLIAEDCTPPPDVPAAAASSPPSIDSPPIGPPIDIKSTSFRIGSRHLAMRDRSGNMFLLCREGIYLFANMARVEYNTDGLEQMKASAPHHLFVSHQGEVSSKSNQLLLQAGNDVQIKTTLENNQIKMNGDGIRIATYKEVLIMGGQHINFNTDGYIHLG